MEDEGQSEDESQPPPPFLRLEVPAEGASSGSRKRNALLQVVGELSLLVVSGALLSTAAMPTE